MAILKKIIILIAALVCSYFAGVYFGRIYSYFFRITEGGLFGFTTDAIEFLIGVPFAYVLFLTFGFTLFGGRHKYWWIGILLIPAAIFEVYFDFSHIYFPILLGFIGWLLGYIILKLISSPKPADRS